MDRPQDVERPHRKRGPGDPRDDAILERYRAAMRAELDDRPRGAPAGRRDSSRSTARGAAGARSPARAVGSRRSSSARELGRPPARLAPTRSRRTASRRRARRARGAPRLTRYAAARARRASDGAPAGSRRRAGRRRCPRRAVGSWGSLVVAFARAELGIELDAGSVERSRVRSPSTPPAGSCTVSTSISTGRQCGKTALVRSLVGWALTTELGPGLGAHLRDRL